MNTQIKQFNYTQDRQGAKVIADFRRLLESGDVAKLTPGLYHTLHMHGGFIAHYNIDGFRSTFRGKLSQLLEGESYPLESPGHFCWPALEDSGFKDGLSAGHVMRGIAEVAGELGPMVRAREDGEQSKAEVELMNQLAERHGYKAVAA